MAACDLAARLAGVPLTEALGGRDGDTVALYRSVISEAPAAMAERARGYMHEGYRRIQVKVGADPLEDAERLHAVRDALEPGTAIVCDANGSWGTAAALRFLQATRGLDYVLEQPCASLEECALVRARCERPLALDESITDLDSLLQARSRAGCDAVTIKLARVGGVTRAALMRDAACELGLLVTVEDTGGSDIATAAMAHVSLSTPAARAAPHRRLQRVGDGGERDRHAGAGRGIARRARRPRAGCRCARRTSSASRSPARPDAATYRSASDAVRTGLGGDSSSGGHGVRRSSPSTSS